MRKNIRITAIVSIIVLLAISLVACNNATELVYDDWVFEGLKSEDAERPDGANARIMSANILVHIKGWGGIPVKPRAQMFAEVLAHYQPDVAGLQEVCSDWYKYLTPQIEQTYAFLHPDYNSLHENRSPIIYNKNKLDLLDSGFHKYTGATKNYCRVVTWGVFKNKSDQKTFAVTSTHWDFGMEAEKVAMRNTQVAELIAIINDIEAKHHCPIFATGDYNAYEKKVSECAESYQKLVAEGNLVDVKFVEGIIQNSGDVAKYEDESLDHIFMRGAATPLAFNILENSFYDALTDHSLIFADVKI